MLTKFDDYPIHQTPEPVAHPDTSDRNFYERYWFNGYDRAGELYFGIGMGLYPNRGILDCGFSIVKDGEQHAFHGSRRAPRDPSETAVGPFRIEVLEPMRTTRVVLEPNATGIECDLTFSARTACIEEDRQTMRTGTRTVLDLKRFAQFGRWRGEIRYAGRAVDVDEEAVLGTKDRSWGVRPVGEPEPGGAPGLAVPQVYFLWAPLNWGDHCTHTLIFEDANGYVWHKDLAIVPAYADVESVPGVEDPALERLQAVRHRIRYAPGTRRAQEAELTLVHADGRERVISLEPLLTFRMKGIGYTHPEWGHGRWKGEYAIGGESWKTAELNELAFDNLHIQQVVRARSDGLEGIGVLEQLCIGPHAPSGFTSLIDGAT